MSEPHEFDESSGGYEMFRARAASDRGRTDALWRIGFHPEFRLGQENSLAEIIMSSLISLHQPCVSRYHNLIDVGSGSSPLTEALSEICDTRGITHIVVDSGEMLSSLESRSNRVKITGKFPQNVERIASLAKGDSLFLAYSVIQYVVRDASLGEFLEGVCHLLKPGGVALIGDIPNRDLRDRQVRASQLTCPPSVPSEIRDDDLLTQVSLLRKAGLNAYLCPQIPGESMRLHRENLFIVRPGGYSSGPSGEVME